MHTNGKRMIEQLFNRACKELRLTEEALLKRAYAWFYRGRCKTKNIWKKAIKAFRELHTLPAFVVDFLNDRFENEVAKA